LAKYGVSPEAYIDVKALMGDASDNVPGVPSIGEKTATKIIAEFGSLDNALENISQVKPPKAAANLTEFKDQAYLSKMLVTIVQDAPVELCLIEPTQMWNPEAKTEIYRLELKTFYKRFGTAETEEKPIRELVYEIIKDREEAKKFFANITEMSAICFLWDDKERSDTKLIGIAVAQQNGATKYITVDVEELSLFSEPGITDAELLEMAKPWLESESAKCIYDFKSEARRLYALGVNLKGISLDAMLAAYILNPLAANRTLADVAFKYLGETLPTLEEILDNKGKRGKTRRTPREIPIETAAKYAASIADALLRSQPILAEALLTNEQKDLYKNIEIPVAETLLAMEIEGIKVDRSFLLAYGEILNQRLVQLTAAIYDLAGEEFNINSPAQLGVILFEKLGLKGGKKNTQGYSTAADELEKLADKHLIIPLVLEYRAHAKLNSTYVEGLLPLINPATSRIHSTFNQALTATGRLSSAEPNLQTIPVRMPLGRELRKAFVPKDGCIFVDADYSQIELRLLAHMSGDETLVNAFKEEQDIHRLTASQVLGIPQETVTPEQRNNAKSVNFGIIYGMGAFGLSEDLKISVKEAEQYISEYFKQYPGVKHYMDKTITDAKDSGYVATIYNRRRAMAEFKSSNFNTRAFGERVAMNMPIQGAAADIIKIAMNKVSARLKNENLQSRLILQVHDELLLEVKKAEIDIVKKLLQEEMESAADLAVPLVAEVHQGDTWFDTK